MIRSFAVAAIMATIAAPAFAGPIEDAIAGSWRKPADKVLLKEPQCTRQSRLPGTCSLSASRLGGGASPKYRSP